MNRSKRIFLMLLVACLPLSVVAAAPEGYQFAHGGWCTSEEVMQGHINHSYWAGGNDGGQQRNVCLKPKPNDDIEPLYLSHSINSEIFIQGQRSESGFTGQRCGKIHGGIDYQCCWYENGKRKYCD